MAPFYVPFARPLAAPLAAGLLAGCTRLDSTVVDFQGRAVEVVVAGDGDATVVFEAGLGDGWRPWDAVASDVADHARIFAYSRPGYGQSGATTAPRDPATLVEELRLLLASQDLRPPYVLVGHSFGGTYMELFARSHPDEVSAAVLAEPRPSGFLDACEREGLDMCGLTPDQLARQSDATAAEYEAFPRGAAEIDAAGGGRHYLQLQRPDEVAEVILGLIPWRADSSAPMRAHAEGRIVMWEGASLWVLGRRPGDGAYPRTSAHAHHAVQITIGLRSPFHLETADVRYVGDCAAVAPNVPHTFETADLVAHLFVEPEGRHGRALVRALFPSAPVAEIPLASLGDLPRRLVAWHDGPARADADLIGLGREIVAALADGLAPEVLDPRVRRIVGWATDQLHRPVSLADAARLVGLSRSRARHLFVEQTGLPFRTWLLWTRLTRALGAYAEGASLTDAALGAGFADSAHFSRTFRSMFGITAASLQLVSGRRA